MSKLDFSHIFKDAFNTFKVFDTIPFQAYGIIVKDHSTSIWQILNHLVIWQEFQIKQLKNLTSDSVFNESRSWIHNSSPLNNKQWKIKLEEFNVQISTLEKMISNLSTSDYNLNNQLKIIQESSTHLSFHIGEIILIGRQLNVYPKPHEMNRLITF